MSIGDPTSILFDIVRDLAHDQPVAWDHAGPYCTLCDCVISGKPRQPRGNWKRAGGDGQHDELCPYIRARSALNAYLRYVRRMQRTWGIE